MAKNYYLVILSIIILTLLSGCVGISSSSYYVTRYKNIQPKENRVKCKSSLKSGDEYFYIYSEYEPASSNRDLICKKKNDFLKNKSSSILFATTILREMSSKEIILAKNIPIWGYFANDNDCSNKKTDVILTKPRVYTNGDILVNLYMKQNDVNQVPIGQFKNILNTIGNFATGGLIDKVSNIINILNDREIENSVSSFAKSALQSSSNIYDKSIVFDLSKRVNEYIYPISLCKKECSKSNQLIGRVKIKLKTIKTLTKFQSNKTCNVDFSRVKYLDDVKTFLNIRFGEESLKSIIRDTSERMDSYRKSSYFTPLYKLENRLREKLNKYDTALVFYLTMKNTSIYRNFEQKIDAVYDFLYSIEEKDFKTLRASEVRTIKNRIKKNIELLKKDIRFFNNDLLGRYEDYFDKSNIKYATIEAEDLVLRLSAILYDNVEYRNRSLREREVNFRKIVNRLRVLSENGFIAGSNNDIIELFSDKVQLDDPNSLFPNIKSGVYNRRDLVNLLVDKLEKAEFGCFIDLKSTDGVEEGFSNRASELDGYFQDYKVVTLYQDKNPNIGRNKGFMLILFDFKQDKRKWPKISKIAFKSINSISREVIIEKFKKWKLLNSCGYLIKKLELIH